MFIITVHAAVLCTLVEIPKQTGLLMSFVVFTLGETLFSPIVRAALHQFSKKSSSFNLKLTQCAFGTFRMDPKQTPPTPDNPHEFHLELRDSFKSLSFYEKNEDGELSLKFDPPVYQTRYAAVNSIISMQEWIPHVKKVIFIALRH